MLTKEDKQEALTNPSSVFDQPGDVIACRELDLVEKAAILRQWEIDARLLHVAAEEGMADGEESQLARVKKAQSALHTTPLTEGGAPTKAGP
ncbi:MAG: hypothetical protein K9G48_07110 [Reyranella sp.]|nr:hypothetical protein [Reyranella sp.]